jgi:chaperonin GroES
MNIKPIGERILITPRHEEKTKGGIFIPDSAKEGKKEGHVVAVGTSTDGKEFPVKPGDVILYGGYSSDEFVFDGKTFLILDLKDVLAKLE